MSLVYSLLVQVIQGQGSSLALDVKSWSNIFGYNLQPYLWNKNLDSYLSEFLVNLKQRESTQKSSSEIRKRNFKFWRN